MSLAIVAMLDCLLVIGVVAVNDAKYADAVSTSLGCAGSASGSPGACGVGENDPMNVMGHWLSGSRPARWAAAGAAAAGVIGAIAGLIIGLHAYAPTAPFAVIELGLPAVFAGGLVGFVAGAVVTAGHRIAADVDGARSR